ncbi:hypothetical protein LVJ94_36550 [Pendulispora rubella]|uniref:Methyltransferase type 11 domain-containing protein n=1 Tax=Pendulispora rubella TaxID=2741070 RepID=A0ABZ2KYN2_9BACT
MDPVLPSHLLCLYAEPLAAGRRVLVVGDATQDLGARLLEMGARLVHVYDPDPDRVRRAQADFPRGVVLRHLRDDDLDVRDGAFDLVLVPDVALLEDPTSLVARLRRVVDAEGAVLVAARNPQAWDPAQAPETRIVDYYELYDIVSLQFACVRMVGQVPFFGAAIAELGETDEDPEVSVHTELVTEAEPPEYFIALASHSDHVRLEPYAIVQLPRDAATAHLSLSSTQEGAFAADRAVLAEEAMTRVAQLEAQLDEQRAEIAEQRAEIAEQRAQLAEQGSQLGEQSAELARLEAEASRAHRVGELEQAVYDAGMRIQQLEVDIDRRREHAVAFEEAMRTAEDAARVLEERTRDAEQTALLRAEQGVSLLAEIEALKNSLEAERAANEQKALSDSEEVDRLLLQIGEHEERYGLLEREFSQMAEAHGAELSAVEARLVERGHRIAELEREITRRDRITLGLVAELEERTPLDTAPQEGVAEGGGGGGGAQSAAVDPALLEKLEKVARENADWSAKLDEMAIDTARREGELHARTWRIAELEGELTRNAYRAIDLERLTRLEDELDILRRAISQEHDARLRAESGEELTRARAELQRQAVLLEQLSRELDARDRARAVQDSQEA